MACKSPGVQTFRVLTPKPPRPFNLYEGAKSPLDLTFQAADKAHSKKRYTFSFDLIHGALSVFNEIWLPSLHHISSSPASCDCLAEFQLK